MHHSLEAQPERGVASGPRGVRATLLTTLKFWGCGGDWGEGRDEEGGTVNRTHVMGESPLAWGGLSTKQTLGGLNVRLEYFDFILLLFLHFGFIHLIILSIDETCCYQLPGNPIPHRSRGQQPHVALTHGSTMTFHIRTGDIEFFRPISCP